MTEIPQEMLPELAYAQSASATHRKRFGQFFTPPTVAALMADWIASANPFTVLEPAIGTGILARACFQRMPGVRLTGYEKDIHVLRHLELPTDVDVSIRHSDYLLSSTTDHYDAVIMNPPYIRHREIYGYDEVRHYLSAKSGYIIPKSANLYVYFAVKAALQLQPGGRAAILIPTEWMNANFADTFKQFLLKEGFLREIVLFSGCSNIFEDALTTASILLLERPE